MSNTSTTWDVTEAPRLQRIKVRNCTYEILYYTRPPKTLRETDIQLSAAYDHLEASWYYAIDAATYLQTKRLTKRVPKDTTIKRFIDTYTKKYLELIALIEEIRGAIYPEIEIEQVCDKTYEYKKEQQQ